VATDDELGMAWWNGLSEQERARWAKLVGTGRAKDAWELFKRRDKPTADDPLRDAHTAIQQAIADLRELGVPVPMALYRAAHALAHTIAQGGDNVLPFNRPRQ
jgi:hypothetical protein